MELFISEEEADKIDEGCASTDVAWAAEKKLRRSKAKNKGKSINELVWYITYCERVEGHSLEDIFSGKRALEAATKAQRTVKEQGDDIVSRTSALLCAKMPGAYANIALKEIPLVLRDEIHIRVLKEEAEQARVDALSPEESEAEMQELLSELEGPGFMALKI